MEYLKIIFPLLFTSFMLTMCSTSNNTAKSEGADPNKTYKYVELSKDLVRAAKNKTDYADTERQLAVVPLETLADELSSDEAKKAFWINVYNANVQLILSKNPELFEDRGKFFGKDRMTIAGEELSFDEIEHGIIRGSKIKWLLGLVKDPFVSKYERKLRVDDTDGRIHFALNCGAASCPYVAIYDAKTMNKQLDIAARQYLQQTSDYKPEEEKVYVTSLFSWFRGDFGGKSGVRKFLKKYEVIPEDAKPDLEFKKYDWTLELGNFKEINVADAS